MSKAGSTRQAIRLLIEKMGSASGPELAQQLGITRQAVGLHLRQLIAEGAVFKTGSTRAARYFPASAAPQARKIKWNLNLAGLDESVVYGDLVITLNLSQLPSNVEAIMHYAFTEMLNNVIDHSMSDRCTVEARLDATRVSFTVKDFGIGVFHSIADKLDFANENTALIELVKGKTTTMPQAHSGEGIFFASRSADHFALNSHRLQIEWDQAEDDIFVSDTRFLQGTLVKFEILRDSRTRLEDVFSEFAPEKYDFQFQRTRVLVKLLRQDYVSRSEAKRLLHGLDKFSEIELDMRDVKRVGQGFADEIYRVFAVSHPDIVILTTNAAGAVDAMLRHVRSQHQTIDSSRK